MHLNHFYQEYIGNKEHVHMNATKWPSLTEFAKFLGREGICRVEEDEKGVHVSWVDNSPENLRRQDAVRRKERQDRGDEEREQRLIGEQVRRAQAEAEAKGEVDEEDEERVLKREEGEKIKLSFAAKPAVKIEEVKPISESPPASANSEQIIKEEEDASKDAESSNAAVAEPTQAPAKVSMKMGMSGKPKNVFAAAKKNALGGKKSMKIEEPKKMSEAERIMREEMERNGKRGFSGPGGPGGPGGSGGPAQKKPKH